MPEAATAGFNLAVIDYEGNRDGGSGTVDALLCGVMRSPKCVRGSVPGLSLDGVNANQHAAPSGYDASVTDAQTSAVRAGTEREVCRILRSLPAGQGVRWFNAPADSFVRRCEGGKVEFVATREP